MMRRSNWFGCVFVAAMLVSTTGSTDASGAVVRPDVLRTGGPSAPGDAKVAVFAVTIAQTGVSFDVLNASNAVVYSAPLVKKTKPSPWKFVYHADWSSVTAPGTYRSTHLATRIWT